MVCKGVCRAVVRMVCKGGVRSVVWEVCQCVCRVVVRMVCKAWCGRCVNVGWEMCEMRVDYWPERWERAKSRIGSMPRTKSCGKLWTSQPSVGSTPVSI